jgi:ribosome-associated toxin RatA of RatAB toxin-antitoxin module
MRHVDVHAIVTDTQALAVFDTLVQFERYPALVGVVRSVEIISRPAEGPLVSAWQVYFRNGILRWAESDWLRRDQLRIDFEQTEGDFEEFSGSWQLTQRDDGVALLFSADFDFGVPSLASIIDPVAQRVLTETIQLILNGLFGSVEYPDGALVTAAPSVTA